MSRLDEALQRFTVALDLVEQRLPHAQASDTAGELAELRMERERLLARISSLQEESSSLAGVTEQVENRLDGAIAEIRAVLGRN